MTRRQLLTLGLPLVLWAALLYGLSAAWVPQLDGAARPLTPDNRAYIALCRGVFAGIEEPFRYRVLVPFLARLTGDCRRGFLPLDFLFSLTGALAICFTASRLTERYGPRLLSGLLYLALVCPRAHEAPWLTDTFASAGSAVALALTTARQTPLLHAVAGALAAFSGLGRELLPPLFLRVADLVRALRARSWPGFWSYGPALAGLALYGIATRLIGPQLGDLSSYVADALSDTAAKDDPALYWAAMLRSMYFLWPYGLIWMLDRRDGSAPRRRLKMQAGLVIALSFLQSLLGGDIARLFRLFALPVFAVAAADVAANRTKGRYAIALGLVLALSAGLLGFGQMRLPPSELTVLSDGLLALNSLAAVLALWGSRLSDIRR
jgi:hypothetical protein